MPPTTTRRRRSGAASADSLPSWWLDVARLADPADPMPPVPPEDPTPPRSLAARLKAAAPEASALVLLAIDPARRAGDVDDAYGRVERLAGGAYGSTHQAMADWLARQLRAALGPERAQLLSRLEDLQTLRLTAVIDAALSLGLALGQIVRLPLESGESRGR